MTAALIDALPNSQSRAVYRLLSRNETTDRVNITEEEFLQEIIDCFKDLFEEDDKKLLLRRTKKIKDAEEKGRSLDDLDDEDNNDYDLKYPSVFNEIAIKADQFKGNSSGYRLICVLPRVAFGLVMASRLRSHYTHAPWFRIGPLKEMVQVHGAVSPSSSYPIPSDGANYPTSSSENSSPSRSNFWSASPTRPCRR